MKALLRLPALLAATCLFGGIAAAGTVIIPVTLDGSQEVPPNGSGGSGTATVTLDDVTGDVTVTGSYTGLGSGQTAAHIHAAPAGSNGGVVIGLTGTGGTSGTFSGAGTLTSGEITTMLASGMYINVHTSGIPGGEIRGQIIPSSLAPAMPVEGLVALGVLFAGAAVFVLRRQVAAVS